MKTQRRCKARVRLLNTNAPNGRNPVDYARSLLKRIAPRVAQAILGFWLLLGPFVVFLIRWKAYEVVFIYLLLIGAVVFVGAKSWWEGAEYVRRLRSEERRVGKE